MQDPDWYIKTRPMPDVTLLSNEELFEDYDNAEADRHRYSCRDEWDRPTFMAAGARACEVKEEILKRMSK